MSRTNRRYTAAFKLETVLEGLRGEKSVAQVCRERGIKDTLYYKWRDTFLARAEGIFEGPGTPGVAEAKDERIAELEQLAGRLALENEFLKKGANLLASRRVRSGR